MARKLAILRRDPWLDPYSDAINGRHNDVIKKINELTSGGNLTLSEFANAHNYFGMHRTRKGWTFREWAPNAIKISLIGTFNDWQETPEYQLLAIGNGVWEVNLPAKAISHGDLYKLKVYWNGGCGERIPAYATRVVQDPTSYIFSAQVWAPNKPYQFTKTSFRPKKSPLLIYECHIGMAVNEERVGSYNEFRTDVLPRIAADGYNAIQIMAIAEHPYYGSFGYHVSNFFAPSSRFGTPEELKSLIRRAH